MNSSVEKQQEFLMLDPDKYYQYCTDVYENIGSIKDKCVGLSPPNTLEFTPVFLVGFPRSGTTLLHAIIESHSKIAVIEEKPILHITLDQTFPKFRSNLHEFIELLDEELIDILRRKYIENIKLYVSSNCEAQFFVDKMPLNIIELPLLAILFPEAKFIVATRHPMGSIFSCWRQNFKLNDAMANFTSLLKTKKLYMIAMKIYLEVRRQFRIDVHALNYERMVENYQKEVSTLLKFLDLEWEESIADYRLNVQNKIFTTPSHNQIIEPIYQSSIESWKKFPQVKEFMCDELKMIQQELRVESFSD